MGLSPTLPMALLQCQPQNSQPIGCPAELRAPVQVGMTAWVTVCVPCRVRGLGHTASSTLLGPGLHPAYRLGCQSVVCQTHRSLRSHANLLFAAVTLQGVLTLLHNGAPGVSLRDPISRILARPW